MDFAYIVKSRRSIRKFRTNRVSREVICKIMDLARWAPSAHNSQPWRCIVIDDYLVKKKLAVAMGKAWFSDLARDGVPKDKAEEIIKLESCNRITQSPVVIIICLIMEDMHRYPDRRRQKAEYIMGVQSVAAFIQTLLLSAHYYGLDTCWVCAPLFCKGFVRKVLRIPKEMEPQAMITLGYAAEEVKPPSRKELDEICRFNYWGRAKEV